MVQRVTVTKIGYHPGYRACAGRDNEPIAEECDAEHNSSARACDRILQVARTIADLADAAGVSSSHISKAIQNRLPDRELWA